MIQIADQTLNFDKLTWENFAVCRKFALQTFRFGLLDTKHFLVVDLVSFPLL